MSTPVFVNRRAYLDGTDTESEPLEDHIDTKTPESPLAIAPPIPLSKSTPPVLVPILRRTACMVVRVPHAISSGHSTDMAEVVAMPESAFRTRLRSSYESSPSVSPPDLPSRNRYCGTSELVEDSEEDNDEEDEEIEESMDSDSVSEDAEDEGPTAEDEDPAAEDEGLTTGVEGPGMDDKGYGLDDESRGIDDEGHSVKNDGLGLGYGALRRRELALEEGDVYSTFETDPEDGMIYIDIPDYPPLAPPVQTPPSPEWTSGSLPISPSHSDVPSPISSPTVPLTVPSPVATPAIVETEGFLTKLRAQVEILRAEFCPCVSALHLVARGRANTHTFIRWWRAMYLVYSEGIRPWMVIEGIGKSYGDRFRNLIICLTVWVFKRFWNSLPRMGRAEMVDQARFAWGFLSVFSNANSDRVAITSRMGSYPDTRLRQ
ncbi:hypothetical protein Tco_1232795 [Tanacetum coccineum]